MDTVHLKIIRDDESRSVYETTIGEQQILVDYITGPLGGNVNVEDPPANPRVSVYRYSTLVTTTAAGGFDESAAEIVEYDHFTKRIFVVNAENGQVLLSPPNCRVCNDSSKIGFTESDLISFTIQCRFGGSINRNIISIRFSFLN